MQTLNHVDIINKEDENILDDFHEGFQRESIAHEFVHVCNVYNKGLDTEDKLKEHLNKHHKDMTIHLQKRLPSVK